MPDPTPQQLFDLLTQIKVDLDKCLACLHCIHEIQKKELDLRTGGDYIPHVPIPPVEES